MSELSDAENERLRGQAYRTGQLAGREDTVHSALALIRAQLGEHMQLSSDGWRVPDTAYRAIVTAVSRQLEADSARIAAEFEEHRAVIRAASGDSDL